MSSFSEKPTRLQSFIHVLQFDAKAPIAHFLDLGCIAIKTNTLGQILLNADYFVRFWNVITNTQGSPTPQDMSYRKDYCVGCKAPLVDETVKGDLTDNFFSGGINSENARDNNTFANMVVGSKNGCRNCIVFLDALSFVSRSKDQKRRRFTITPRERNRTLCIDIMVLRDEDTEPFFMQVFRQSSMSN